MRVTVIAALLSAGTACLCQTGAPRPAMPEQQGLPQITIVPFNGNARVFHLNPDFPLGVMVQQKPEPGSGLKIDRIDPRMVVHPPQTSVGEQAPGTLVAQNLYPGLRFAPIDQSHAAKAIPVAWPELQVKNIPTSWPKMAVRPVQKDATPAGK
jgi:hypothetical protein